MNKKEFLQLNFKKNWRFYRYFLLLIIVLEIFMIIYGLSTFDFTETRRVAYFCSYVFLLLFSIISLILGYKFIKDSKYDRYGIINFITYSIIIIFWSAFVSALDMIGDGYAVTYLTILAAIGSMIAISPLFFAGIALLSTASIVLILSAFNVPVGLPFYINHTIFLIVAIAVQTRAYFATNELYNLNIKLEQQTKIDGLTNVFNRRYLDMYMTKLVEEKRQFTFALIDVDNFKTINDQYGHSIGDISLSMIASMLSKAFGENVFRYGGDEFAVVSFLTQHEVSQIICSINEELKKNQGEFLLQMCAGIFQCDRNNDERQIFELADKALYQAKNTGKSKVIVYGD